MALVALLQSCLTLKESPTKDELKGAVVRDFNAERLVSDNPVQVDEGEDVDDQSALELLSKRFKEKLYQYGENKDTFTDINAQELYKLQKVGNQYSIITDNQDLADLLAPVCPVEIDYIRIFNGNVVTEDTFEISTIDRLANCIIFEAIEKKCEGFVIEKRDNHTAVKFINSFNSVTADILETFANLDASKMEIPGSLYVPVISRFKINSNMNIMERIFPQEGSFQFKFESDTYLLNTITEFPNSEDNFMGERLVVKIAKLEV